MSATEVDASSADATVTNVDLKLEVVVIPVSDVDRAKAFYGGLGWRLDADFPFDNGVRIVQITPPGSPCSIQFGDKLTTAAPGSAENLYLVVADIDTAREALMARGAQVSEVFHPGAPGAQFQPDGAADRVPVLARRRDQLEVAAGVVPGRRDRAAGPAGQLFEAPADLGGAARRPQRADHADRLAQRRHGLAGRTPRPAHGLDRVPERAGAQAELSPAAAEQVQAGHRPGQHGRRAQRQVGHVGREPDPAGAGGDVAEQRPGVQERRLVGVVLEGHQVQPGLLGEHGEPDGPLRVGRDRGDERPEQQRVAVVSHDRPSA